MIRTVLMVLILAVLSVPAGADVAIRQTNTGKGMGMSGTTRVTIFDVANQRTA
jgi:hypothetical protein